MHQYEITLQWQTEIVKLLLCSSIKSCTNLDLKKMLIFKPVLNHRRYSPPTCSSFQNYISLELPRQHLYPLPLKKTELQESWPMPSLHLEALFPSPHILRTNSVGIFQACLPIPQYMLPKWSKRRDPFTEHIKCLFWRNWCGTLFSDLACEAP